MIISGIPNLTFSLFLNISSTCVYYATSAILHYKIILDITMALKVVILPLLLHMLCMVSCNFFRKHNVSSNALRPTWIPYVAAKAGEEQIHFSLKLMTGTESSSII